jgi:hypothetical protein
MERSYDGEKAESKPEHFTVLVERRDVILKFRQMVSSRYDYWAIQQRFNLPDTITPEVIADIQDYFLQFLYPSPEDRRGLEMAFENLGRYVRQPQKIFGIFGNLAAAVFKFGKHFFQALRAAFGAFDAFIGAQHFEQKMVAAANRAGIRRPMSDDDFEDCMAQLERQELEQFVKDVVALFRLMMDVELQRKTIGILDNVIATMKSKPGTYPPGDIEGITLGRTLLERGQAIFSKYDERTREDVMQLVEQNEFWYLDRIYLTNR